MFETKREPEHFGILPECKCCMNCKHFYQHYIVKRASWGWYADPIYVGHCCYPRFKSRKCGDVCEHFERIVKEE